MKNIKLVALDVDGTMTNGEIIYNEQGHETKVFNAKDGLCIHEAITQASILPSSPEGIHELPKGERRNWVSTTFIRASRIRPLSFRKSATTSVSHLRKPHTSVMTSTT